MCVCECVCLFVCVCVREQMLPVVAERQTKAKRNCRGNSNKSFMQQPCTYSPRHTHTHSCHTNAHTRSAVMLCTKWHKSTYTPTQTEREREWERGEGDALSGTCLQSYAELASVSQRNTQQKNCKLTRFASPPRHATNAMPPSSALPPLSTPCFESACHCLMCPLISTLELLQQRQQRQHPSLVGAFAFSIPSHQKFIKFFSVAVAFFGVFCQVLYWQLLKCVVQCKFVLGISFLTHGKNRIIICRKLRTLPFCDCDIEVQSEGK